MSGITPLEGTITNRQALRVGTDLTRILFESDVPKTIQGVIEDPDWNYKMQCELKAVVAKYGEKATFQLIERRRARRIDLLPLTVDYDTTLEDQVEEADVRSNYDISDKAYPASRQGRTGHETVSLVLRRMLAAEAPNARCVRNGLKDTWSSSMPNLVALIPTNERCEISELVALAQYWRQLRDGRIMFVACVGEHSWCATDGVRVSKSPKPGSDHP